MQWSALPVGTPCWQNVDMTSDSELSLDELVALQEREAALESEATRDDAAASTDDDVVVLSWWQHPANIVTMVLTAALLAGMIGWMIGDGSTERHNDVDTGFLQDMRTHHEQAVLMSLIYRNLPDTEPGLRTVARSIVVGQNIEIGRMIQLLRNFGEPEANLTDTSMAWMGMAAGVDDMPGMASDDELDQLGRLEGREADELFVELMTEHHLGGVDMAEFAVENAANSEVVSMAASMASAQTAEIGEMERLLGGG